MLHCWDSDDSEEVHHLKWDSVIANGMLVLEECADENTIRTAVKESLTAKFPLLGANDFEFVKVRQKAVSTLHLGPGTEYNYSVVKKVAGQGLLHLKVKQGFEFVYNAEAESDEDLLKSAFDSAVGATTGSHTNATLSETDPEIQNSDLCSNLQAGGIADPSWDSNGRGAAENMTGVADSQRVEINQDLLEYKWKCICCCSLKC